MPPPFAIEDAYIASVRLANASLSEPLGRQEWRKTALSVWKAERRNRAAPADKGEAGKRSALYVCLGDVPARPVDYEWHRRLVRGSVNLIVGDPGMGKGFIELDIAGTVTRGSEWPDNSGKASDGAVILLTAEDALAETVRPASTAWAATPRASSSSRPFTLTTPATSRSTSPTTCSCWKRWCAKRAP